MNIRYELTNDQIEVIDDALHYIIMDIIDDWSAMYDSETRADEVLKQARLIREILSGPTKVVIDKI
jgi:hypothetical protein